MILVYYYCSCHFGFGCSLTFFTYSYSYHSRNTYISIDLYITFLQFRYVSTVLYCTYRWMMVVPRRVKDYEGLVGVNGFGEYEIDMHPLYCI